MTLSKHTAFFRESMWPSYIVYVRERRHVSWEKRAPCAQEIGNSMEASKTHDAKPPWLVNHDALKTFGHFFRESMRPSYIVYIREGTHISWEKRGAFAQEIGNFLEASKTHDEKMQKTGECQLSRVYCSFWQKTLRTSLDQGVVNPSITRYPSGVPCEAWNRVIRWRQGAMAWKTAVCEQTHLSRDSWLYIVAIKIVVIFEDEIFKFE